MVYRLSVSAAISHCVSLCVSVFRRENEVNGRRKCWWSSRTGAEGTGEVGFEDERVEKKVEEESVAEGE